MKMRRRESNNHVYMELKEKLNKIECVCVYHRKSSILYYMQINHDIWWVNGLISFCNSKWSEFIAFTSFIWLLHRMKYKNKMNETPQKNQFYSYFSGWYCFCFICTDYFTYSQNNIDVTTTSFHFIYWKYIPRKKLFHKMEFCVLITMVKEMKWIQWNFIWKLLHFILIGLHRMLYI